MRYVTIYTQLQRKVRKEICYENLINPKLVKKGVTSSGKRYEKYLLDIMGNRYDYSASVMKQYFEWLRNDYPRFKK